MRFSGQSADIKRGLVDVAFEVDVQIYGRAGDEVAPALVHQQRGQTFVGRRQTRLQIQESREGEAGVAHGARLVATGDPLRHTRDVQFETGFVGAAV